MTQDDVAKIQEEFKCDEHLRTLNEGTKTMFYNLGIFTLMVGNLVITYDIKTNSFVYDNQKKYLFFYK